MKMEVSVFSEPDVYNLAIAPRFEISCSSVYRVRDRHRKRESATPIVEPT